MSSKDGSIVRAAQFARKAHEGQQRKYTNRPYITHPVRVAGRVATLDESNATMVAASFLHDIIEDCGISYAAISDMFGKDVADLVLELTNDKTIQGNRAERKRQNRERIKNASKEAKIIKLVDRIDNLYELDWSDGFTSEHLYMNAKALFFEDKESSLKILSATTPRDAKKLGRQVKNFDQKLWDEVKFSAMLTSLRYKFLVCPEFRQELMSTGNKTLVEASPYDKIWGIGMKEDDPNILKTELWGKNLLGECLMVVRDENE